MILLGRSSHCNALILNISMIFYLRKGAIQKCNYRKKMNINLLIQISKNDFILERTFSFLIIIIYYYKIIILIV